MEMPCANVTQLKHFTLSRAMTVAAGTGKFTNFCSTSGAVNITAGSSATNQTSAIRDFKRTELCQCYLINMKFIHRAVINRRKRNTNPTAQMAVVNNFNKKKYWPLMLPLPVAGTAIVTCSTTGAVNIGWTGPASQTNRRNRISSGTGTLPMQIHYQPVHTVPVRLI